MAEGVIFVGQAWDYAGRAIAPARLRTVAERENFDIEVVETLEFMTADMIFKVVDHLVKTKNIKFVGISVAWLKLEYQLNSGWYHGNFFKQFKEKFPSLLLITGGQQTFKYHDLILKYSDYHFNGFSDRTFVEFLKKINNLPNTLIAHRSIYSKGYYVNSDQTHPVEDVNSLETVFKLSDEIESHQTLPIELSRGCIFRCAFCRFPFQGKKDYDEYQRSPQSIANELKRNYELFGTTRYTLMDDTFNDSLEKIERLEKAIEIAKLPKFEFCSYIKPELLVTKPEMIPKLVNLGLRGAYMGLESFNNPTRKVIGKGMNIERILDAIHKLNTEKTDQVRVTGAFIIGLPHETQDQVLKTNEFLIENAKTLIHNWEYRGLLIFNDNSSQHGIQSEFDKDPAKFGYEVIPNTPSWKSEFFTSESSSTLARFLTDTSRAQMFRGGWWVAASWQMNKSDDYINNEQGYFNELIAEQTIYKKEKLARYMQRISKQGSVD